ncbi:MAG: hypothetical protein WA761_01680 [Thermoplasmata archaeon]
MLTAGITAGVALAIGLYAVHGGRGFGGFNPGQFASNLAVTVHKSVVGD